MSHDRPEQRYQSNCKDCGQNETPSELFLSITDRYSSSRRCQKDERRGYRRPLQFFWRTHRNCGIQSYQRIDDEKNKQEGPQAKVCKNLHLSLDCELEAQADADGK